MQSNMNTLVIVKQRRFSLILNNKAIEPYVKTNSRAFKPWDKATDFKKGHFQVQFGRNA